MTRIKEEQLKSFGYITVANSFADMCRVESRPENFSWINFPTWIAEKTKQFYSLSYEKSTKLEKNVLYNVCLHTARHLIYRAGYVKDFSKFPEVK
jgi:hypothetical protein